MTPRIEFGEVEKPGDWSIYIDGTPIGHIIKTKQKAQIIRNYLVENWELLTEEITHQMLKIEKKELITLGAQELGQELGMSEEELQKLVMTYDGSFQKWLFSRKEEKI